MESIFWWSGSRCSSSSLYSCWNPFFWDINPLSDQENQSSDHRHENNNSNNSNNNPMMVLFHDNYEFIRTMIFTLWICCEITYYIYFKYYMIPLANQRRKEPIPFLTTTDYCTIPTRNVLLFRIIDRFLEYVHYIHNNNQSEQMQKEQQIQIQQQQSEQKEKDIVQQQKDSPIVYHTYHELVQIHISTLFYKGLHPPGVQPKISPGVPNDDLPIIIASKSTPGTTVVASKPNMTKDAVVYQHQDQQQHQKDVPLRQGTSYSDTSSSSFSTVEDEDDVVSVTSSNTSSIHTNISSNNTTTTTMNNSYYDDNNKNNKDITSLSSKSSSSLLLLWTITDVCLEDFNEFVTHCLYGKTYSEMIPMEIIQLQQFYDYMHEKVHLLFYSKYHHQNITNHYHDNQNHTITNLQSCNESKTTPTIQKVQHVQLNPKSRKIHISPTTPTTTTTTTTYRKPMRLNFENMGSIFRPIISYVFLNIIYYIGCIIFLQYCFGFQRVICPKTKLTGWYKPAPVVATTNEEQKSSTKNEAATTTKATTEEASSTSTSSSSYVFFHGIAPCGVVLYLPMIYMTMIRTQKEHQKSIFLFENPNISSLTVFNTNLFHEALSELQVSEGVYNIIQSCLQQEGSSHRNRTKNHHHQHQEQQQQQQHEKGSKKLLSLFEMNHKVTLMGHSFGSCHVTWLLRSKFFDSVIESIVLLDPVSILFSDPDTMSNFLYRPDTYDLIRIVGSSELYIEQYLRRQFAWYNSELWLEYDIRQDPYYSQIPVIVALSGRDTILPAPKVKDHITIIQKKGQYKFDDEKKSTSTTSTTTTTTTTTAASSTKKKNNHHTDSNIHLIYWENALHGDCIYTPSKWWDICSHLKRKKV